MLSIAQNSRGPEVWEGIVLALRGTKLPEKMFAEFVRETNLNKISTEAWVDLIKSPQMTDELLDEMKQGETGLAPGSWGKNHWWKTLFQYWPEEKLEKWRTQLRKEHIQTQSGVAMELLVLKGPVSGFNNDELLEMCLADETSRLESWVEDINEDKIRALSRESKTKLLSHKDRLSRKHIIKVLGREAAKIVTKEGKTPRARGR